MLVSVWILCGYCWCCCWSCLYWWLRCVGGDDGGCWFLCWFCTGIGGAVVGLGCIGGFAVLDDDDGGYWFLCGFCAGIGGADVGLGCIGGLAMFEVMMVLDAGFGLLRGFCTCVVLLGLLAVLVLLGVLAA